MTSPRLLARFTPWKLAGFIAGFVAFVLIAVVDSPLHHVGNYGDRPALAAATATLMAIWWLTEALPIYVTACVPLVLFPLTGVFGGGFGAQMAPTLRPYAHEYVFLFAGGMCIGAAMQQQGLDRRIALSIMRRVGTEPKRLLFGFLASTAFISMWISNTATAAMMLPIGIAVVRQLEQRTGGKRLTGYGCAIMMSIAYAANIGGIGTKIGTAPNGQLCGRLHDMGIEVSFLQFTAIGFPFVVMMLPIAWWLLWRIGRSDAPQGADAAGAVDAEIAKLGRMSRGERIVLTVFAAAAALWIVGMPIAAALDVKVTTSQVEGGVAVLAALVLLVSRDAGRAVLGREALKSVPWETLLLLGGSFAMAAGIEGSGLSKWIAEEMSGLREKSPFIQVLTASVATVGVTAVASNTATVGVMLPLLRDAVSPTHVITVLFASTIAASCDFALPAGTPPNAIVFGSGYVSFRQMARTGVVLDLIAALLAAVWAWIAVPLVF